MPSAERSHSHSARADFAARTDRVSSICAKLATREPSWWQPPKANLLPFLADRSRVDITGQYGGTVGWDLAKGCW